MDKNDRAIAVAQDVLAHLKVLRIRTSHYFIFKDIDTVPSNGDLRDYVDLLQKECGVCLLGACLFSRARLFDDVPMLKFRQIAGQALPGNMRRLLVDVFDRDELDLMEAAFEKENVWDSDHSDIDKAIAFGKENGNTVSRVRAVMNNIIANDGHFIP